MAQALHSARASSAQALHSARAPLSGQRRRCIAHGPPQRPAQAPPRRPPQRQQRPWILRRILRVVGADPDLCRPSVELLREGGR
eukprot:6689564-Pyramimonas_sp.AAC.1